MARFGVVTAVLMGLLVPVGAFSQADAPADVQYFHEEQSAPYLDLLHVEGRMDLSGGVVEVRVAAKIPAHGDVPHQSNYALRFDFFVDTVENARAPHREPWDVFVSCKLDAGWARPWYCTSSQSTVQATPALQQDRLLIFLEGNITFVRGVAGTTNLVADQESGYTLLGQDTFNEVQAVSSGWRPAFWMFGVATAIGLLAALIQRRIVAK